MRKNYNKDCKILQKQLDELKQFALKNEADFDGIKKAASLLADAKRKRLLLKVECLDKMIFRSPEQLRYAITQFLEYWNHYRPHAGLNDKMVLPYAQDPNGEIQEVSFLGGLLHGYRRVSATA